MRLWLQAPVYAVTPFITETQMVLEVIVFITEKVFRCRGNEENNDDLVHYTSCSPSCWMEFNRGVSVTPVMTCRWAALPCHARPLHSHFLEIIPNDLKIRSLSLCRLGQESNEVTSREKKLWDVLLFSVAPPSRKWNWPRIHCMSGCKQGWGTGS